MNTLTPHHLALEDSLGESLDRINAQAEAAITRIEEMAAKADRRTAFELTRFRFQSLLGRVYGTDSVITATLGATRYRTLAEQGEIYRAYIVGRSLHDRSIAIDIARNDSPPGSVVGMPPGLSYDPGTGILSGTPTTPGPVIVTFKEH